MAAVQITAPLPSSGRKETESLKQGQGGAAANLQWQAVEGGLVVALGAVIFGGVCHRAPYVLVHQLLHLCYGVLVISNQNAGPSL